MYLAINFVIQMVGAIGILVTVAAVDDSVLWSNQASLSLVSTLILPLCIGFYLVFSVVFYWVTSFIFKKKLNLE